MVDTSQQKCNTRVIAGSISDVRYDYGAVPLIHLLRRAARTNKRYPLDYRRESQLFVGAALAEEERTNSATAGVYSLTHLYINIHIHTHTYRRARIHLRRGLSRMINDGAETTRTTRRSRRAGAIPNPLQFSRLSRGATHKSAAALGHRNATCHEVRNDRLDAAP